VPPQSDAGPTASTYCYGDVPCAPVAVAQPSPDCVTAGANTSFVTSVGASTTGYAESSLALPGVGVRTAEPDFRTCMVQATPTDWMNGYGRPSAFRSCARAEERL
jgi:hypothetical protein